MMNLLADKRIKGLFCRTGFCVMACVLLCGIFAGLLAGQGRMAQAALCVGGLALCTGILILTAMYLYFREEHRLLEGAAAQIQEYLRGNPDARIECEEEGELYRLFHEINSLAAILNTHAKKEADAKSFMKNTIQEAPGEVP